MAGPPSSSDHPGTSDMLGAAEEVWQASLAEERDSAVAEGEPFLVMRVGSVWLGLDVSKVEEVSAAIDATPIPLVPAHIPGVIALHGQVVPLLDLQQFLELDDLAATQEARESFARVVAVSAGDYRVGLLAHQVRGIVRVSLDALREPHAILGERLRAFTSHELHLRDSVLAVLDLPALLDAARVAR